MILLAALGIPFLFCDGVGRMFFSKSHGFSGTFSQVVELCTLGFSASQRPDVNDAGTVQREDPLDAFVVNDSPDGEHFIYAAASARDDNAGKYLDSLFVALDDSAMYVHGVSYLKMRNLVLEALAFDGI